MLGIKEKFTNLTNKISNVFTNKGGENMNNGENNTQAITTITTVSINSDSTIVKSREKAVAAKPAVEPESAAKPAVEPESDEKAKKLFEIVIQIGAKGVDQSTKEDGLRTKLRVLLAKEGLTDAQYNKAKELCNDKEAKDDLVAKINSIQKGQNTFQKAEYTVENGDKTPQPIPLSYIGLDGKIFSVGIKLPASGWQLYSTTNPNVTFDTNNTLLHMIFKFAGTALAEGECIVLIKNMIDKNVDLSSNSGELFDYLNKHTGKNKNAIVFKIANEVNTIEKYKNIKNEFLGGLFKEVVIAEDGEEKDKDDLNKLKKQVEEASQARIEKIQQIFSIDKTDKEKKTALKTFCEENPAFIKEEWEAAAKAVSDETVKECIENAAFCLENNIASDHIGGDGKICNLGSQKKNYYEVFIEQNPQVIFYDKNNLLIHVFLNDGFNNDVCKELISKMIAAGVDILHINTQKKDPLKKTPKALLFSKVDNKEFIVHTISEVIKSNLIESIKKQFLTGIVLSEDEYAEVEGYLTDEQKEILSANVNQISDDCFASNTFAKFQEYSLGEFQRCILEHGVNHKIGNKSLLEILVTDGINHADFDSILDLITSDQTLDITGSNIHNSLLEQYDKDTDNCKKVLDKILASEQLKDQFKDLIEKTEEGKDRYLVSLFNHQDLSVEKQTKFLKTITESFEPTEEHLKAALDAVPKQKEYKTLKGFLEGKITDELDGPPISPVVQKYKGKGAAVGGAVGGLTGAGISSIIGGALYATGKLTAGNLPMLLIIAAFAVVASMVVGAAIGYNKSKPSSDLDTPKSIPAGKPGLSAGV